jgi:hypothetical protein
MARNFSFTDLLNSESMKDALRTGYDRVDIGDITPSDGNFYDTSDVSSLKDSIYLIGVQEPVIVNLSHGGGGGKYRMVSGHRRLRACTELVAEGHPEFGRIPAIVCDVADPDEEKAVLIMTNSTQRVLTGWEKVNQYMELKPVLKKLKEGQRLKGRARAVASCCMGVSEGQIALYNLIGTKLIRPLMDVFKAGGVSMELAAEAARLTEDEQGRLSEIAADKGAFTRGDIDRVLAGGTDGNVSAADTNRDGGGTDGNVSAADTYYYRRGMYEPGLVDELISEWDEYRRISEEGGGGQECRCYCILDALKALKALKESAARGKPFDFQKGV